MPDRSEQTRKETTEDRKECCKRARATGDWNEGPGGNLYCPECGERIAYYRQN